MAQFANEAKWGFDPAELTGGSPTYTDVAEIVSIDFGGIAADALDSTVHGDSWRTRVPGLKDAGTVTIGVRLTSDEVTHESILDEVGTMCAHRFIFPSVTGSGAGITITVDGMITSAAPVAPHDGLMDMSVTVQLSGQPTIVTEAS